MRAASLLPIVLAVSGIAVIADAVVRGSASVALVVVFPVVYGNDAEFLLGVVLLVGAFLTLPLAFGASVEVREPVGASHHGEAPSTEAVGLVLIGPVPIFFGGWRALSWKVKAAVAAVGAVLVVGLMLVLVLR
ncbi:MAG: hypothetical protein L3J92_02960 [Thermoplasmata archaeon]|jgi:uncharacterized membrane protein|nr:hypothetical protein [Thermoplasmata archaeon]